MSNNPEPEALFEIDPDWKDQWRGMPEYSHQDLQPDSTLLVHFKDKQARADFAKFVEQPITEKTKFIWFPRAEIRKASDKVFTGQKVIPRYPIYIISKGRADSRLTSKAFEWAKIPYHICVEPQEYAAYAAVIDPAKILTLPFSNLGQGGIPARNFVWNHSRIAGATRHWIFDDNISGFCRFQDNLKVEVDNGALHCAIEDFVDRYENVKMAAFNYDYFAPRKQGAKIKPITWNTRCYSGILLSNDLQEDSIPMQWRGRYNEDTDLSLRILKAGGCTTLFNAFLMYKKPTLTMKGGNTDELYAGAEEMALEWEAHASTCETCKQTTDGYDSRVMPCTIGQGILSKDGRWLMADSLREQHPDCTSVERKWRRWQHCVDYRRFQVQLGLNVPKLREDVIISERSEYELELSAMPGNIGHDARNTGMSSVSERPAAPIPGQTSAMGFILDRLAQPEPVAAAPGSPPAGQGEAPALRPESAPSSPGQPASLEQPKPAEPEPIQVEPDREPEHAGSIPLKIDLEARGHKLFLKDDKFFITNASTLTDDDRRYIKLYRDEIIASIKVPVAQAHAPEPEASQASASPRVDAEGSIPSPAPTSLFEAPRPQQTLAEFLGSEPPRVVPNWTPDEPPDLSGVDEIVLNFATDGLDWTNGAQPVGVTVSTMDGRLVRFLPFGFRHGGNLDPEVVKRWASEQLRNKKITNANTRFDMHVSQTWGVDLEAQGCTFSDIQHTAALLDDHRAKFRKDGLKPFAIDTLALDYLPGLPTAARVDESQHAEHHASEVAEREKHTAELVWRLRDAMYPELDRQELREVQALEDSVIPAVVEMERNGSPLDLELLERYHVEANRRHDELLWEVAKEVGFAFDHTAKSWQRLFETLGLPPTDGNAEATIVAIDNPIVKKAHLAAQYASLDSKTFKAYKENVGADGILRCDINQLRGDDGGTVSGRFSIGYVQQVPNYDNHFATFGDELYPRRLFIPVQQTIDGWVVKYFDADAMQIEQRLLVHYANNERIIAEYADDLNRLARGEEPVSYHKITWKMIKEYKPDMLYTHQKSFNFAFQYGAKSIKLAVMMGFITAEEGAEIRLAKRWDDPRLKVIKEIEAAYKKMFPESAELLDRAAHLAKPRCDEYCRQGDKLHRQYPHRGYVKTLVGRRSRFPEGYKPYIGLNRVLQGTGADIMKKKLAELHRERKHTGLLLRMTVHDNVGGDAMMRETQQRASEVLNAQSYPTKVPILWSTAVGPNWAACK